MGGLLPRPRFVSVPDAYAIAMSHARLHDFVSEHMTMSHALILGELIHPAAFTPSHRTVSYLYVSNHFIAFQFISSSVTLCCEKVKCTGKYENFLLSSFSHEIVQSKLCPSTALCITLSTRIVLHLHLLQITRTLPWTRAVSCRNLHIALLGLSFSSALSTYGLIRTIL